MSQRGGKWKVGGRKDNRRHSLEKWRAFSQISQFYSPTASSDSTASVPASNVGFHFILSSWKSIVEALDVNCSSTEFVRMSLQSLSSLIYLRFGLHCRLYSVQSRSSCCVKFFIWRDITRASFNINFSEGACSTLFTILSSLLSYSQSSCLAV